jgi:hypothetical protein
MKAATTCHNRRSFQSDGPSLIMHDDGVLTRIATPKLGVYGATFRDDRMLPDNGWLLTVSFAIIDECLARPFFATKQATHGILSIPAVLRLLWLVERPKSCSTKDKYCHH